MQTLVSTAAVLVVAACACFAEPCGIAAYRGVDPIGGGAGYTKILPSAQADYVVSNLDELKSALGRASAGQIVYVADGAEIDATGECNLAIASGVTLAGNRGLDGSAGPLIHADNLDCRPLFVTGGPGVRVTGLRIKGPDTENRESAYVLPNSDGIRAVHPDLEVDNCEIWGWSHAGIELTRAGTGHRIHHNHIHHCRRWGLGYGVCLHESQALITANLFVDNRHDIAGTGRARTSYKACSNISDLTEPKISHAFDMHGNHESRKPGEEHEHFAGDSVVICHNTFRSFAPRNYIVIRGRPRQGVTIHHNVYENPAAGGLFRAPCDNALVYGDRFERPPTHAYYVFDAAGCNLNGRRMEAGAVTSLPGRP